MKKLLLATLLFAGAAFAAKTTVADTLYRADGSTCAGTISLSWPTFTSSDGHLNVAGRFTSQIKAGALSVSIEPGNYYTVIYNLVPAGCAPSLEYWDVPISGTPVNLAAVRSLAVPVAPPLISLASLSQGGATNGQCMAWNGTQWAPIGCGSSSAVGGTCAVQFANSTGFNGDAANLCWDNTLKYLGLGLTISSPLDTRLTIQPASSSKAIHLLLPAGETWSGCGHDMVVTGLTGTDFGGQDCQGAFWVNNSAGTLRKSALSAGGTGLASDALLKFYSATSIVAAGSYDTAIGRNAAGVVEINNGTAGTYRDLILRTITPTTYATATNCADSAGAAACGSAAAGAFVIDVASTSTVVSTTAVTTNSEIFVQFDSSLGTRLGITCNTTPVTVGPPTVTARTAATSFTVTVSGTVGTNVACLSFHLVN